MLHRLPFTGRIWDPTRRSIRDIPLFGIVGWWSLERVHNVAEEMLLSEMGPRPRDESTCAKRLANLLRSGPAVGPTCRIGWMQIVQHDVQYLRRERLGYTGSCHPDCRRIKS